MVFFIKTILIYVKKLSFVQTNVLVVAQVIRSVENFPAEIFFFFAVNIHYIISCI